MAVRTAGAGVGKGVHVAVRTVQEPSVHESPCWPSCLLLTPVCLFAVEIATLTRENGKTVIRVLKQKEVEQLIKKHEEEEAKAEREKKEKEQKEKDK